MTPQGGRDACKRERLRASGGPASWLDGGRTRPLETEFEAVVAVGDEVSLFESARQLHVALAVVDLSLRRGDGLGLIRRMRSNFPRTEADRS